LIGTGRVLEGMTLKRPWDSRLDEVDSPRLADGVAVVYFDPEPVGDASFRRAVATGPEIIDPRTHDWWAPVLRPDRSVDLLPAMLIVAVFPVDD
jgi:hypothetical protein